MAIGDGVVEGALGAATDATRRWLVRSLRLQEAKHAELR
jgi:hypothetical protein